MTAGVKRALRMGSAVSADGTESKQPLGARAAGSLTSLLLLDPCNGLGAPSTARLAAPSRSKRESPISGQMRHTPRPHRRGASRAYAGGSCFAWLKRTSRGRRLALAARPRRKSLAALATSQRGIDLQGVLLRVESSNRPARRTSPLTGLSMPDSVARCPRSPALPSLWRYSPSEDLRRSRPSRQRPNAAGCPPTTPSCWPKPASPRLPGQPPGAALFFCVRPNGRREDLLSLMVSDPVMRSWARSGWPAGMWRSATTCSQPCPTGPPCHAVAGLPRRDQPAGRRTTVPVEAGSARTTPPSA